MGVINENSMAIRKVFLKKALIDHYFSLPSRAQSDV
jgi:hypothetical protein